MVDSMANEHCPTKMVKVHEVSMVKPATPTPHHFMFLSDIDIFWLPVKNIRRVLVFKPENNESFSSILETLKRSLSDVLVEFYPVAGRLSINKDTNRPEIECNDAGVEVTEATIDTSFEEIEANNEFANRDFCNKLAPPMAQLTPSDLHPHTPLLSLQVTGFATGGFCIGIALQHVMADGNSFWHLMNSWAELSRGLPSISAKPIHDRAMYRAPHINSDISYRAFQAKSDDTGEARIFKFIINKDVGERKKQNNNNEIKPVPRIPKPPENLQKLTHVFRQETIKELKEEAQAKSSFAAVVAQSLRCMLKARDVSADDKQVLVAFLANCRGRVSPPLPYTYFGNFLTFGIVKVCARRVVGEENISFAAKLLEETVDSCTSEEQVRLRMAWSRGRAFMEMFKSEDFAGWTKAMGVTGSHRFPVYDCDFGWGMPLRLEVSEMSEVGSIFLAPAPPPNQHNGIHITTFLPPDEGRSLGDILSNTSVS